MREACTNLGSLAGLCYNPIWGNEAKTLPKNTFSWAWSIGRTISLSRQQKQDPIQNLVDEENGSLLFSGKIISVTRHVARGFTRGRTILQSFVGEFATESSTSQPHSSSQLVVEFENENLSATLHFSESPEKRILALCPDLITFLDKANGAPLGVSDYKYGLRVSVIALRASPVWTTEKGLEMGGPKAFGLDTEYVPVAKGEYTAPKSVWDLFA